MWPRDADGNGVKRWFAQAGDGVPRDNGLPPRWEVLGGPYTRQRAKERCKTAADDAARVGGRVLHFRLVRPDGTVDELCRPPHNGRLRWTPP